MAKPRNDVAVECPRCGTRAGTERIDQVRTELERLMAAQRAEIARQEAALRRQRDSLKAQLSAVRDQLAAVTGAQVAPEDAVKEAPRRSSVLDAEAPGKPQETWDQASPTEGERAPSRAPGADASPASGAGERRDASGGLVAPTLDCEKCGERTRLVRAENVIAEANALVRERRTAAEREIAELTRRRDALNRQVSGLRKTLSSVTEATAAPQVSAPPATKRAPSRLRRWLGRNGVR